MANLHEDAIWEEGVYQLETTDVVLGGPDGISNKQAQQLANRTAYLHSLLGTFMPLAVPVTGLTVLDQDSLTNTQVVLQPDVKADVILDGAAAMPNGSLIRVICNPPYNRPDVLVNLQPASGMVFRERAHMDYLLYRQNSLALYWGESITFMKMDSELILLSTESNLYRIGEILHSFSRPTIRCVMAGGGLVNRADYPRLWQAVRDKAISETGTYLLNPGYWRGAYTDGNGTTTFRIPDLRGVFLRASDHGAGLDVDRSSATSDGSYLPDEIKSHSHGIPNGTIGSSVSPDKLLASSFAYTGSGVNVKTANWGANETRPKNIAYTAYIIV